MIMNENRLNTADPEAIRLIEEHMRGFLFGEGSLGALPRDSSPRARRNNQPHCRHHRPGASSARAARLATTGRDGVGRPV